MKSDNFLFEFFQAHPHQLMRLLHLQRPGSWSYQSVSLKQTERRIDGLLLRQDLPDDPILVELQGYRDERIYWRLTQEICLYFMGQEWKAVQARSFTACVIFLDEEYDPGNPPWLPQAPHRLIRATLKTLLQELEQPGPLVVLAPLTLDSQDALRAQLPHYQAELERLNLPPDQHKFIHELMIQAIITRFKGMTAKEVEAMITISPLRETTVIQEWLLESRQEGRQEARQESTQKHFFLFWESRFGTPVEWVRRRIETCTDIPTLELLMKELAQASDVSHVEAQVKARLGNGV